MFGILLSKKGELPNINVFVYYSTLIECIMAIRGQKTLTVHDEKELMISIECMNGVIIFGRERKKMITVRVEANEEN